MSSLDTDVAPASPSLSLGVLLTRLWRVCRPWAGRLVFLATVGTAAMVLQVKYRAESNLLSIFLAYLPVWLLALPCLVAMFVGIFFACWRSSALAAICAVTAVAWLGGYRIRANMPSAEFLPKNSLVLVTYNRGQGGHGVLGQFLEATAPDIAVFQDAGRRLPQLAALPQFAAHAFQYQKGEFALLSRWPLLENEVLNLAWPEAGEGVFPVGTRSIVDWAGRPVVVYNVHFPTPRDLLYWYGRRGTFLYGVLGLIPGTTFHERHQKYLGAWAARLALATQLVGRLRSEKHPVLLMGDLNLPPVGHAYHQLCEVLQDAHVVAGRGFGHTFPGNMKSLARLISPWTRIDHILVSGEWEVGKCHVSTQGSSQHLPVSATVRLR